MLFMHFYTVTCRYTCSSLRELEIRVFQQLCRDLYDYFLHDDLFLPEGEECQNWNMYYRHTSKSFTHHVTLKSEEEKKKRENQMMLGSHTHLRNHKWYKQEHGEHNYCRAFVYNYLRVGQVRPPECLKMSAKRIFTQKAAKMFRDIEECDVPVCSPCMYGDGRGNLPPYKHKLPIYNGTIRETFRQ